MKEHRCCMEGRECANCDNSKFAALFRGNVSPVCKRQFFHKNFAGIYKMGFAAVRILNNNLTSPLYRNNDSVKSSPQSYSENIVQRNSA